MVLSRHGTGMCMMMDVYAYVFAYLQQSVVVGLEMELEHSRAEIQLWVGMVFSMVLVAAGILHTGMAVTGVAIGPVTGDRGGIIIIRTIRRMDGEEDGMVILIPTITAVQRMWYGEVLWALYSTIMAELEVV